MAGFHDKGLQEVGVRESRAYRSLPLIETAALFGAIASLVINVEYAEQLSKAPPDGDKMYDVGHMRTFSNVWAVFYCGTAPVVSIILALIDVPLYIRKSASPVYALVVSTILAAGWIPCAVMWVTCDYSPTLFNSYDSCFQWTLQTENGEVRGVSAAITAAMVGLGLLMILIYLTYVGFAAAAVHVWRTYNEESVPMIRKITLLDAT
ncbi:hypothetical protein EV356DRAFT_507291 [Viridothelium virens]|uniref:Uncharacterized protein n=1 Tax=Viridothelium virens TaxID=1048519 RepID=A0A6A6HJZ9_VIRVR|nr:hypothetical protein EV356DRAFT_507291 [Viridothelium virens]